MSTIPKPTLPLSQTPAPRVAQTAPAGALRGRGALDNPTNRFERYHYDRDEEALAAIRLADHVDDAPEAAGLDGEDEAALRPHPDTLFLRDPTRKILSRNASPDVPFDVSINPYRGCEHGCIYCYARPGHEFLGFSAGLDFETRILVKEDAPELLRDELLKPKYRPKLIGLSGVTDPYQPIERKTRLTRRCLEVLAEFRNPVGLITKNALVRRDVDVLRELTDHGALAVSLSITTLDDELHRVLEPRTSSPRMRLEAVRVLADAGIPVGVNVAPVIPGLNCHEIPSILEAAAAAGARTAGHIVLRLPHGVKELFEAWLREHRPERADKVLNRLRSMRGGALDDSRFGTRMKGEGIFAQQIHDLFDVSLRRAGLARERTTPTTEHFRRPPAPQLELF